jgi:hypothetical protein
VTSHSDPTAYHPLARLAPGADPGSLRTGIDVWATSEAMRELAAASGWSWPGGTLRDVLGELSARSAAWDFRRQIAAAPSGRERQGLIAIRAVVNGHALDESMVARCARQLGIVGAEVPAVAYSHVVVLAGTAAACLNRAHEGERRRRAAGAHHVAVLASNRLLGVPELTFATEQGWRDVSVEGDAAAAAAADVFALGSAPAAEDAYAWPGEDEEARRRRSWSHRRWEVADTTVEVVVAPSADPDRRRTDTADQLVFWAERAGIDSRDDLLLVTTEHYVPYQQLAAVRALGRRVGCGIATCGVSWAPEGFRAAAYLQEVRSTLLAAAALLDALWR